MVTVCDQLFIQSTFAILAQVPERLWLKVFPPAESLSYIACCKVTFER
jgi:hypothetical protein